MVYIVITKTGYKGLVENKYKTLTVNLRI